LISFLLSLNRRIKDNATRVDANTVADLEIKLLATLILVSKHSTHSYINNQTN